MSAEAAMTYSVEAYNLSHASENKIHDDSVAQKLGFSGGLVPGVEVYAYACHLPVARWGRAWLERGRMDCRFLKPVYDGKTAIVSGEETLAGLDIKVESSGTLCATATAHPPVSSPLRGGWREAPGGGTPDSTFPRRPPPLAPPRKGEGKNLLQGRRRRASTHIRCALHLPTGHPPTKRASPPAACWVSAPSS